jgi:predicted nucleotide-binding protein
LTEGKADTLALLNEAVKSLREDLADIENSPTPQPPATQTMLSNEIFIVRGHDGSAKVEVARLIEHAGLMAVILHEQPNAGRTIIEKFEHHAGALGFAVAILTPDDVGGRDKDHLRARARQNVVGELFWFAGKLGRACVCALRKGDVEIPSDFAGVVYTEMDDRGAWRAELLRELQNAGYTVDWAKALA